jgi:hypothetical protein
VAVSLAVGLLLYSRASNAGACGEWRRVLAEQTDRSAGSVGSAMAQQFRREAIWRGWIDLGDRRVVRPSGCTP